MPLSLKLFALSGYLALSCLSAAAQGSMAGSADPVAVGSKTSAPQGAAAHVVVLLTPPKVLFPKVIELLLDQDYIILLANQDLGLITFRLQAEDKAIRSRRHVNVLEGTLLLQEASPASTRLRVKLTQSWQESSYQAQHETGVQADADAAYYKAFFKMLENASPASK